jgi:hypothetical protein
LPDVLDRRTHDDPAALDREFDRGAGLPQVERRTCGDADAAAKPTVLRPGRGATPEIEPGRPGVEPLAVRIGVPSLEVIERGLLRLDEKAGDQRVRFAGANRRKSQAP